MNHLAHRRGSLTAEYSDPVAVSRYYFEGIDFWFEHKGLKRRVADVRRAGMAPLGGVPNPVTWPDITITVEGYTNAAVQEAVELANSVAATGKKVVVLFPDGTYEDIDRMLVTQNNIWLKGQSRERTILRMRTGSGNGGYFDARGAGKLGPRQFVNGDSARGTVRVFIDSTQLTTHSSLYQPGKWLLMNVSSPPASYDGRFFLNRPSTARSYDRALMKIVARGDTYVDVDVPHTVAYTQAQTANTEPIEVVENVGISDMTIIGNSADTGFRHVAEFEWVVGGWMLRITASNMPSYAHNFSFARHIEIDDCEFANPNNVGGGGNGYAGLLACEDVKNVNCTYTNFRHGPLTQAFVRRSLIAYNTYNNSDAHLPHAGWARDSLIINNTIRKASSGKPFYLVTPQGGNPIHTPGGENTLVAMNDFSDSGQFGRLAQIGPGCRGFTLAWNKMRCPQNHDTQIVPSIHIFDFIDGGSDPMAADGFAAIGNVVATSSTDARRCAVYFAPGANAGAKINPSGEFILSNWTDYKQTGLGIDPSLTPFNPSNYGSTNEGGISIVANTSKCDFVDNNFVGYSASRVFMGEGAPRTNLDNTARDWTGVVPEVVVPAGIPSDFYRAQFS